MNTNDQKWGMYNQNLMKHAKNFDWGLYRNTKLDMYKLLIDEGRNKQALTTLLEICYLDLNGPRNCGGNLDAELRRLYPPWDKAMGFLAPKLIGWITDLKNEIAYSTDDVQKLFLETANTNFNNLKLPVKPDLAWEKMILELRI